MIFCEIYIYIYIYLHIDIDKDIDILILAFALLPLKQILAHSSFWDKVCNFANRQYLIPNHQGS